MTRKPTFPAPAPTPARATFAVVATAHVAAPGPDAVPAVAAARMSPLAAPALTRRGLLGAAGAAALAPALLPALAGSAHAANALPLAAPIHVGRAGLRVRDAETVARWYRDAVGLTELTRDGDTIWLGAGAEPLLALRETPGLQIAPQGEAGLFHTAFLLPSRADLARWITMAIDTRVPVDGVADHLVSEAIYLTDPEGNGVEIYADTPQDGWRWRGGQVEMATDPLNVEAILATPGAGDRRWSGAPAGTVIGHMHLKVGDARQAGQWWQDTLGFEPVRARPDAVFLSTGRYHHHVAVNEWMSAGAGRRSERLTGLDFVELHRSGPGRAAEWQDDWGTVVRIA